MADATVNLTPIEHACTPPLASPFTAVLTSIEVHAPSTGIAAAARARAAAEFIPCPLSKCQKHASGREKASRLQWLPPALETSELLLASSSTCTQGYAISTLPGIQLCSPDRLNVALGVTPTLSSWDPVATWAKKGKPRSYGRGLAAQAACALLLPRSWRAEMSLRRPGGKHRPRRAPSADTPHRRP